MIPSFLGLTLLGLAAYRTWRIVGEDTITERLRKQFAWKFNKSGGPTRSVAVLDFISCPWCLGFWIALAWWGAWQLWPHATLVAAGAMAVAAVVGLIGHFT